MARAGKRIPHLILTLAMLASGAAAQAQTSKPSVDEEFSIGSDGAICHAVGTQLGTARQTAFDRKWAVICQDVATPVGSAYSLRSADQAMRQVELSRADALSCEGAARVTLDGVGPAQVSSCMDGASGLEWRSYRAVSGKATLVVEGLAAYDSALRLTLASLVRDRIVPGTVEVVSLGRNNLAVMAQARANVTDTDTLIGQGYRSNNAGAYAEAAEIFQPSFAQISGTGTLDEAEQGRLIHELTINRALQLSNLGEFGQASHLFEQARALDNSDPVQQRLLRNFEAIDALHQGRLVQVTDILDRAVPRLAAPLQSTGGSIAIGRSLAAGLNAGGDGASSLMGQDSRLSSVERAAIIDAQADYLRGTVLRISGDPAGARRLLTQAEEAAVSVKDGRVISITRLRAQIRSEIALAHEDEGDMGSAEALLREALAMVELQYPDSASVNGSKARLAGFLARRGRTEQALEMFAGIIASAAENRTSLVGFEHQLKPYFELLAQQIPARPELVADMFMAAQLIERPGVAETLSQLARQFEGGDDEAAALFRRSLANTRELERNRIALAQSNALAVDEQDAVLMAELVANRDRLQQTQQDLLTTLSAYPQYRSISSLLVTEQDMRAGLKPDEAYLKLLRLGDAYFAVYLSRADARGWKVGKSADEMAELVAVLRDSISVTIGGVRATYPFDVDAARELYEVVLGPVSGELASTRHLIFEPDGALLQLPVNLLVTEQAGVDAYHQRVSQGADEYDFRGLAWLGRNKAISTALSATSFMDARAAPVSKAKRSYLGLGNNSPLGNASRLPNLVNASELRISGQDCSWPVAAWNQPISDLELQQAASVMGAQQTQLLTGSAFSDTNIQNSQELDQFRIIHFATHGLVSAPRAGCPARPALLTSFGGAGSDGLLRFDEIFDLHLDADLVILSACDTAGQASLEATREAGVSSGGGQAFDGLVRAFVGAGGRQVIASHWPAPDDYGATNRLFSAFFGTGKNASMVDALTVAQRGLMDDAETSHPFYWSGFAVIGDGDRPLFSQP